MLVVIEFPDSQPNGGVITQDDIENWFHSMSKAMRGFTGIEPKLIEISYPYNLAKDDDDDI